MHHFQVQLQDLRVLAETFFHSRRVWWETNFGTVYMDERQRLDALDWMVMEGNRCLYRKNYGSYIDTMLQTLDNFEWIRWGNYPRRCQFKQRFFPKGDHEDWAGHPHIEPPVKISARKYHPKLEYAPLVPNEFDPIQEAS
jgi:hypothetical protein